MPVTVRKSTTQKTIASKRRQQENKRLSNQQNKIKCLKAKAHHIPGPIQLRLGLGGPPPLKVPPLEQVYLATKSQTATTYALQRHLRNLRQELLTLKSKSTVLTQVA